MMKEQLAETEIIEMILAGKKDLFEILIRRNNPYLYKVGRSYSFSHEQTRDLMQDTFIDAYRNLGKFEGRSSFKTWIIRIMLNNCYRQKQKASEKNESTNEINERSVPMFSDQDKDDTGRKILSHELNSVIEDALVAIPFEYRITFSLREINGLSTGETADLLGITQSNVKVRLNRAKALLRKEIEKVYSATEIFEFNNRYCDRMVERVLSRINESGAR